MKNVQTIVLAALLAGLVSAAAAQSEPQSKATMLPSATQTIPDAAPPTVAYPDSPAGTPMADSKGAPVVTDRAACPASGNGRCPDRPEPSGSASGPAPAQ